MAFAAAALPYLTAAGAAYSAGKQADASYYNSQVAKNTATTSINEANAQANQLRRVGRQQLGKQLAAFGAADVGYGGSTGIALDESALNQETDALNTRYKGTITAYGYNTQSQIDNQQANEYSVLAGASALKGIGSNYTYVPPGTPQQPSTAQNNPSSSGG